MPDIVTVSVFALAAAVALLLYALIWRATRGLGTSAKILARGAFALVLVAPVLAIAVFDTWMLWETSEPLATGAPAGTAAPGDSAKPVDDFQKFDDSAPGAEEAARREAMLAAEQARKAAEEAMRRRLEEAGASEKAKASEQRPPPAARNGHPESGPHAVEVAPSEATEEAKPDGASGGEGGATYRWAEPPPGANGETAPRAAPGGGGTGAAAPAPEPGPAPPAPEAAPMPPPAAAVDNAPAPAPPSPPETRALDSEEATEAPSDGAPAPVAGGAPEEKWDVVPVFYGTDRARAPNEKRLDYGSDRGRRLELGRALVTVPKAHEVPAIERPWAIRIPLLNVAIYEEAEDPKSHFTMKEIKALSQDAFLALVRERLAASSRYKDHAFIFVHGYNTSFDYAIYRTAQIAYDLKFDGAPFAYSWPSGGGLASYTYDRESSGQSEPYLKEFVELVLKKTGAKSVSIIAHSMGNEPTLQVLKDLRAAKPAGVLISQIILAAPDVDRDNFENIAREIKGLAKGVTLYAAANDRALQASRNFYGGIPRAGDVPVNGPLVLPGVDTIDVTAASMDSLGLNHSGYAENNALLSDIGVLLLKGGKPQARTPALEQVLTERGPYWRFPASP